MLNLARRERGSRGPKQRPRVFPQGGETDQEAFSGLELSGSRPVCDFHRESSRPIHTFLEITTFLQHQRLWHEIPRKCIRCPRTYVE